MLERQASCYGNAFVSPLLDGLCSWALASGLIDVAYSGWLWLKKTERRFRMVSWFRLNVKSHRRSLPRLHIRRHSTFMRFFARLSRHAGKVITARVNKRLTDEIAACLYARGDVLAG
jgi:hypothetical protein